MSIECYRRKSMRWRSVQDASWARERFKDVWGEDTSEPDSTANLLCLRETTRIPRTDGGHWPPLVPFVCHSPLERVS